MSYIIDLILLGLLIFFAIRGYLRGFLGSILKSGRFFLAVVLTVALTNPIAAIVDEKLINPPIYEAVNSKLTAIADTAGGSASRLLDSMPAILRNQLGEDITATGNLDRRVDEWSETISDKISFSIAKILTVILLFVALMLLLTILIKFLSAIIRATSLGKVDRILGLVLGLFVGIAVMLLASRFLAPILTAVGQEALVESSVLLRIFG